MARPPSVYESLKPDKLSKKQEKELRLLEEIIDEQLLRKDSENKKFVTVKIERMVPDTNVLFELSRMYKMAGWEAFIFSPHIDRIYTVNGFWKIRLEKAKHCIVGSDVHIWSLLR